MDSMAKNSITASPAKTNKSKNGHMKDENQNPNLKMSKSPITKPVTKSSKKPNSNAAFSSPKNKIRDRKFVIAKKNSKREKTDVKKCSCKEKNGNSKCVCLAYEILRASQEEFFKKRDDHENGNRNGVLGKNVIENGVFEKNEKVSGFSETGNGDKEPGSGKVMSLIKAFESLKTGKCDLKIDDLNSERELECDDKKEVKLESQISSSSICPSDFLRRSSSLDSNQGSFTFSSKGSSAGRRSRRNSIDSCGTVGGRRWRKKQQQLKATRQQPFKLLTEQRGKEKEEEFTKKLQDMKIEEQKQRIPVAQGLPWTTDEPENLVKPPVKDITIPVDLMLHSDMRAVERAEFDQQLAEKEALIEQFKMERERQQKIAEEEEIKKLRKELIPKAQPMPYFDKPFMPKRKPAC